MVFFQSLMLNEGLADDVDAEAEEVLNELNLLTETEDSGSDIHTQGDPTDWGTSFKELYYHISKGTEAIMIKTTPCFPLKHDSKKPLSEPCWD